MSSPVVGFAGMTHLGLVSATAVAAKGFCTQCYDPDRGLIERLRKGELPVHEPALAALRHAIRNGEVDHEQHCDGGKIYLRRSALDRWRQGG